MPRLNNLFRRIEPSLRLTLEAYLVAVGPIRNRAWVVDLRHHGCLLGFVGRPLGGLLDAVLKPLGASWGPLRDLLGPLLGLLGAS